MNAETRGGGWIQPDWWGPPRRWIGGSLPLEPVIARSHHGVVCIENIRVYPTGLSFRLQARSRPGERPVDTAMWHRGSDAADTTPSTEVAGNGTLRSPQVRDALTLDTVGFGVEFHDGRQPRIDAPVAGPAAFTILDFQHGKRVALNPTENAILNFAGASSGPGCQSSVGFLWPLPIGGLRVFASWPEASLPEDSVFIEREQLSDALSRATDLPGRASS